MGDGVKMESISQLEERHDREIIELRESIKQMLKGAKKSTRAQLEAQAIQMEFDLKAKHRDELEELEGKGRMWMNFHNLWQCMIYIIIS